MGTAHINSRINQKDPPILAIVIPVFNEQEAIEGVLKEWLPAITRLVDRFVFYVWDDGSTDRTPQILERLAVEFDGRLQYFRHSNSGHGQTCLRGYQAAIDTGAQWILQIDSDGQCDPSFFPALWSKRLDCEVVYGFRSIREDGFRRILAGKILRLSLKILYQVRCPDPNVPYRLMRCDAVAALVPQIPESFVLANVALAALIDRKPDIKTGSIPIRFRERAGGEPSVPFQNFAMRAIQLFQQMASLKAVQAERDSS